MFVSQIRIKSSSGNLLYLGDVHTKQSEYGRVNLALSLALSSCFAISFQHRRYRVVKLSGHRLLSAAQSARDYGHESFIVRNWTNVRADKALETPRSILSLLLASVHDLDKRNPVDVRNRDIFCMPQSTYACIAVTGRYLFVRQYYRHVCVACRQ